MSQILAINVMNRELYSEIGNTYLFEMNRQAFFNHARMFLTHYRDLSPEEQNKQPERPFILKASSDFSEKIYMGRADWISSDEELDETDVIINVIRFSGPIMRNGGACAYGSKELRDMIIRAANVKQCIGQIFIVDTPGGSSFSKFDFKEALEVAHRNGQMTAMYVDGMLCSAGMAWGALCQKRYARNEHCVFGCMGTYAAFYTNKNGDVNTITQEMFHEVYATDSPMKNRSFRDAAEGNDKRIEEEVTKSNQEYKAIIKTGIPNVTEEQLQGGDWEASEVIGTLCDGIRTLDEVVNEILLAKGIRTAGSGSSSGNKGPSSASSIQSTSHSISATEKQKCKEKDDDEQPETPADPEKPDDGKNKSTKKNKETMGKKYEKIQSVLGLEALESDKDDSLWLSEEYADVITAYIGNAEKTENALAAKLAEIKQLNETIKTMRSDHALEIEKLNEAHENALKQERETASATLLNKEEEFNTEKTRLDGRISELEQKIGEQNTTIEEKDKKIAELSETPGNPKQPKEVHETGESSNKSFLASSYKTPEEQRAAARKRMDELRKRI